ncbi:hypothetical protein DQ04_14901000, partial [Trypanosoma grayi]|uniref:hypothetical protein n=1 Tax=Trypanosoma grayi TaxID=71804 RepID=UPI0004F4A9CF
MDAVAVAQSILNCEGDAALEVLSLAPGLPPVVADTPVAEARRNYMRLAGLVHPDKMKGRFERATEAFQRLVHAFELIADPKHRKKLLAQQAKGGARKKAANRTSGKGSPQEKQQQLQGGEVLQLTEAKGKSAVAAEGRMRAKPKQETPKKRQQKTKKKKATSPTMDDFIDDDEDYEDTDDDEDEDEDEDEDDEAELASTDAEPVVSTSR